MTLGIFAILYEGQFQPSTNHLKGNLMPSKGAVPAVPMRILKINVCPSLSGRSELTYHLGCDVEGDIHFRVAHNSGTGQFNSDPISLSQIEKALSEYPASKPMTSAVLRPPFRGKSSNSPAFLFAALMAEGIVRPGADQDGGYLLGDVEAFKLAMSALIASDATLDAGAAPVVADATKDRRKSRGEETA